MSSEDIPPSTTTTAQTDKEVIDDTGPTGTFTALKGKIAEHYNVCSSYYYSLWGEHIHHGYFTSPSQTKESAQEALIQLLLRRANLTESKVLSSGASDTKGDEKKTIRVLDVGCGIGGTSRYLAKEMGWEVTGVTISKEQVKLAYELSQTLQQKLNPSSPSTSTLNPTTSPTMSFDPSSPGSVQFKLIDATTLSSHFPPSSFDIVWISEALSHMPLKPLIFQSISTLLSPNGKLVMADWFRASEVVAGDGTKAGEELRIIEEGMLLPPLESMSGYEGMILGVGLRPVKTEVEEPGSVGGEVRRESGTEGWLDISKEVAKTWDISLSLIASPSLWAFAFAQGKDFISFLKSFNAMRSGFANGAFRYAVGAYEKVVEEK